MLFVTKDGRPADIDAALQPVERDGRRIYLSTNTAVNSGLCKDNIVEAAYDAATYEMLDYDIYQYFILPSNLIVDNDGSSEYRDLSEEEALAMMAAAGFDKTRAFTDLKQMPY